MDEAEAAEARYWCHMCSQMVNPIVEVETIKCPLCLSGFVEEMNSTTSSSRGHHPFSDDYNFGGSGAGGGGRGTDLESDRALSLWAPILLGMMRNPRRRRRLRRRFEFADEDYYDEDESSDHNSSSHQEGETELDRELESIIRRRRRSSATILQLLHGIRAGMLSESDNPESESRDTSSDIRDTERVILINPFNQTIIVQGSSGSSYDSNNPQPQNRNPIGSLGDYFIGPGLDLLLQHLAENDPNRYGTAPAQKESVEAMPTVKIKENLQCSVCLEDFEVGTEAKEMPCNHKFHSGCILPWLELHSSCPVCRYQLPSDESKLDLNLGGSRNNNSGESNNANDSSLVEEVDGNGRRFSVPLPWPLSSLFSASGNGNSSSTASASSTNASTDASRTNEN